jgi:hypothetical protein
MIAVLVLLLLLAALLVSRRAVLCRSLQLLLLASKLMYVFSQPHKGMSP